MCGYDSLKKERLSVATLYGSGLNTDQTLYSSDKALNIRPLGRGVHGIFNDVDHTYVRAVNRPMSVVLRVLKE